MALSPLAFPPMGPTTIAAVPIAAVGITLVQRGLVHALFFYASSNGDVRQCHLVIEGRIVDELVRPGNYAWTIPPLDELVLQQLGDLCAAVGAKGTRVPYGFRYSPTTFSPSGAVRISGDSIGLTCATFVMAMFLSVGVALLDEARWGGRAEDASWQEQVWVLMATNNSRLGILESNLDKNLSDIPCHRFRPEEVVSAARFPPQSHPVTFDTAAPLGAELVAKLRST